MSGRCRRRLGSCVIATTTWCRLWCAPAAVRWWTTLRLRSATMRRLPRKVPVLGSRMVQVRCRGEMMTAVGHPVSSVNQTVRRLAIPLGMPYEESVAAFERTIPKLDVEPFRVLSDWNDVAKLADELAPLGFFWFHKIDVPPFMVQSGSSFACVEYLMGNHVIAERMYRYDPTV